MTRPAILLINRVYPPVWGATGRLLRDLARSLARKGWDVTVLTTGPNVTPEEWDGGVRVVRVKGPEKPRYMLGYIGVWVKLLWMALRMAPRDLVVTMTDPPFLATVGGVLSLVKKSRHIHWCQDLYPDLFAPFSIRLPRILLKICQALSRFGMKRADKVVVIGRCMHEVLEAAMPDSRKLVFIPNWPDFELSFPQTRVGFNQASVVEPEAYDEVLNGFRLHNDQIKHGPKFRVLYAGHIGRAHPVETILEAARILQEDHPEIDFVFVGNGPQHTRLIQERLKQGLENIRLLPYQPAERLKDLMESGDVHLVSLQEDAVGMVVPSKLYAALAAHRPCIFIGPSDSEVAKVIEEFGAGVVVPQGAGAQLAEEIRQLRLSSDRWFSAHTGAGSAAGVYVPMTCLNIWSVLVQDLLESGHKVA